MCYISVSTGSFFYFTKVNVDEMISHMYSNLFLNDIVLSDFLL